MGPSPAKAANCALCGVHARRAESASPVRLCSKCARALLPLSPQEAVRLQVYAAKHPVAITAQPKRAPTVVIHPVSEELLPPPPTTPETVLTFRKLGYSTDEIAALLQIPPSRARRLLTLANRGGLAETARDFIHTQFLPKLLKNIDKALDADEGAEISLKLADKLGLLEPSAPSGPPVEAEGETTTFETYRLSILKRRTTHHPAESTSAVVDATSVIDVSDATEAEPARIALPSPQGSGSSD